MNRIATVLFAGLLMSACATPYQTPGPIGGVSVRQIDASTAEVNGIGNALTPDSVIRDHVMLRAAEETLRAGYGHFVIVSTRDDIRPLLPNSGYTIMIRMLPGPNPPGAAGFDARQVASTLGPKYRQPQS
jgi:hypothetical protein